MDEDIVIPIAGMIFVLVLAIGIPLVRAYIKRQDRLQLSAPSDPQVVLRLDRIENAIEAMSVEIERVSEGQRFVTKLLADRAGDRGALPASARRDG